jgi:nucleoid-associated protein YgaU
MADGGQGKKASIRAITDESLEALFSFNPTQRTETASASWKQTPAKGKGKPKSEFTGTMPGTLTLDALFVAEWGGATTDVEWQIANLLQMTWPTDESVAKGKPTAPAVNFWSGGIKTWGPCIVKSVSIKYTLFDDKGTCTRATASITLEELLVVPPGQNPSSGGVPGNRAHVVSDGDSLASIAYREYDNAALWRGLADLNGIDDPMRLRVGQRLMVPPYELAAARS